MCWADACLVGELHVPVLHLLDRAKVFRYEHMPRTDLFSVSKKRKEKPPFKFPRGSRAVKQACKYIP